ncbi:glyoxalase I, putative [Plasmodium gallinaceum]|uniref:Glyoxalase I, putative n=1 Tax=Plasmodium gallinaceum TaxID=5849 RepID=A0A1J1GMR3_PLAGA|nr:glyoxalase I, putative [Plasmodium gallinaceum]CRG93627.1 glyoxalase I, putative [Plasmodium gallinaceum]
MKIFLVLIFSLFLKKYYFLNILKGKHNCFINKNNSFKKNKRYICRKLKCKLEGIEYKVQNLDASIDFYKNVLNFHISDKEKNFAKLTLGNDQAYIKLIQNEGNMNIGEHSFLGLGIKLNEFEINKTKLYKGNIEEQIEKRPITPCILPDEDAQIRKYWNNCFITDPDGYGIEIVLEKEENKLDRVRFFTTSTKDSQKFYTDILGMDLVKIQSHLEEISYPWNIYGGMSYFFSSKLNSTLLQFAYAYDEDKLHMGNSLGNLILSFKDLNEIEKKLNENNIEILKKGDDILVKDLNGYSVYLRKNK